MFINFEYIIKYSHMFVEAFIITLKVSVIGIIFSIILGLIIASIIFYKIKILDTICKCYIELSRNTPLLVQLFFLYYGLPKIGIVFSSFECSAIGLTFLGASYMAEAFRSGFAFIDKSQFDNCFSLGLNKIQTLHFVILPQVIAFSVQGVIANIIFLIKETSVVSAVALADLMYVAKDLIGLYYNTTETLLMLVVAYLIILLPVSICGSIIEKKMRYAIYGN